MSFNLSGLRENKKNQILNNLKNRTAILSEKIP